MGPLTPRQYIVLKAASQVDVLPFPRYEYMGGIPYGVYRSLRMRGYLREVAIGYEITPEGRVVLDRCRWYKYRSCKP